MLWKLLVTTISFVVNPFRIPTEIPDVATPSGPQSWNEALAGEALHGPGGDMRFGPDQPSWAGLSNSSYYWPRNSAGLVVIPYETNINITGKTKQLIKEAADQYKKNTCIRFVERSGQVDYINIIADTGCYSYVGRQRRSQTLSIGRGCENKGTIVHEFGHAAGFGHEHQRSDRDRYLNVYENNVKEGERRNFRKNKASDEAFRPEYDYESIMHYGEYAFSKQHGVLKTMEAKNGTPLKEPYQRPGLNKK
ncbi:astacin-like metalloprotease toxin 1 [Caerostris extrusa]|uniref:Metalloendopeptidase n=1 Tax=Caerostris extrusa TaxID=172846 RepID=A0AAV4SP90_CAEEX|nr:astacin-like metalloprotease toxin 1 [Caerostris extrusa]